MLFCHGGTDPKTHLLAVAATKAAKLEGRVVVYLIVLKQRGNPIAVLGHHVLVGRKVARSHDDGLAADVLDVVAIRIGATTALTRPVLPSSRTR